MSTEPLMLDIRGLDVAYGGIRAVRGLDLRVGKGELVCLIGANGAGKSTTLRAITGLVPTAAGQIEHQGESIIGLPSHQLVRRGVVMVPEGRGIFPQLTIEENLAMGAYTRKDHQEVRQDIERIYTLFPRLAERKKQSAGTLSGGEQQMVAMGRAMISRPSLLLLDEPSMGLAPIMVERIFELIQTIAKEGVTILLIEQNARLALELGDRGYVMESGQIILEGPAAQLLHDPKVRAAYLGEEDFAA
ncbi:ABC transporter ATP-binding protein [Alcaligenes aquatilis]|uniref:ABC transporter ATP-binding protein n=1 Tax=Alcaligenes aquatilis TaxID=323284 RepID=UPI003F91C7DE